MNNNEIYVLRASELDAKFSAHTAKILRAVQEMNEEQLIKKNIVDLDGLLTAFPEIGAKGTVYKMTMDRTIPHFRRGKKLLFKLDEIEAWLLENRVKTIDEEVKEIRKKA